MTVVTPRNLDRLWRHYLIERSLVGRKLPRLRVNTEQERIEDDRITVSVRLTRVCSASCVLIAILLLGRAIGDEQHYSTGTRFRIWHFVSDSHCLLAARIPGRSWSHQEGKGTPDCECPQHI